MRPYVLPELPYGHGSLEPHIWGKTLEAHHLAIHQQYVAAANLAFSRLLETRSAGDLEAVVSLERRLTVNLSAHVLHSIYWQNLSPQGGDRPNGDLADAIERDYGNFEHFRQVLVQTAMSIGGSGWAALAWDPLGKRLHTLEIQDHQVGLVQGPALLMVIDAWEHAYFAQYRADKGRYFEAIWKLWNWEDIGARFERARGLELGLERPPPAEIVLPLAAPDPRQVSH